MALIMHHSLVYTSYNMTNCRSTNHERCTQNYEAKNPASIGKMLYDMIQNSVIGKILYDMI